jgi:hypothetical protein
MQSKVDSINSRNQKGLMAKFIRCFNAFFWTDTKWEMGDLTLNSYKVVKSAYIYKTIVKIDSEYSAQFLTFTDTMC